jgi:hypothetical protein
MIKETPSEEQKPKQQVAQIKNVAFKENKPDQKNLYERKRKKYIIFENIDFAVLCSTVVGYQYILNNF